MICISLLRNKKPLDLKKKTNQTPPHRVFNMTNYHNKNYFKIKELFFCKL